MITITELSIWINYKVNRGLKYAATGIVQKRYLPAY